MEYKLFISKYWSEIKGFFWGVVLIIGAFFLWINIAGNPIDELNFIIRARVADGFIINGWEDIGEDDAGRSHWAHSYYYEYRISDGRKFKGVESGSGRIAIDLVQPYPIKVEYLPDDPEVSRIKGSGSPDVFDWLWRKIGLGGLFLALLISPGIYIISAAVMDIRKIKNFNKIEASK